MEQKQMWVRLDLVGGWQAVVPTPDDEAHSTLTTLILISPNGDKKGELASYDCPCKPQIDWKDKIIIHNSFSDNKK